MIEETRPLDAQAAMIAGKLVAARRAARALSPYPGEIPATLAQGYAIQEAAIGLWNDRIAGWKIGLVGEPLRARLGSTRLAGPIFVHNVQDGARSRVIEFPVVSGGFAAVEAEFVFRMGRDAPPGKVDWTEDEAAGLVAALHIGVEIAGSPMPMINDLGPTVVASDFGNNSGLIVGPEIADWRTRLADLKVETRIDGRQVGTGGAASLPGGPMAGLCFLLAHLAQRGRPLRVGQYVSSGAVTGVHDIREGETAKLAFAGLGEITCRAVKATGLAS
jgi:2-keto-4-pentenoate hydratase